MEFPGALLVVLFLHLPQPDRSQDGVDLIPGSLGKSQGFGISPGSLGMFFQGEMGESQRSVGCRPV